MCYHRGGPNSDNGGGGNGVIGISNLLIDLVGEVYDYRGLNGLVLMETTTQ